MNYLRGVTGSNHEKLLAGTGENDKNGPGQTDAYPRFQTVALRCKTSALTLFSDIVLKHPVTLIYHLFHIYFRLKCNLLSSHPSSSLHVSELSTLPGRE
jgi:hypothetical protein